MEPFSASVFMGLIRRFAATTKIRTAATKIRTATTKIRTATTTKIRTATTTKIRTRDRFTQTHVGRGPCFLVGAGWVLGAGGGDVPAGPWTPGGARGRRPNSPGGRIIAHKRRKRRLQLRIALAQRIVFRIRDERRILLMIGTIMPGDLCRQEREFFRRLRLAHLIHIRTSVL